jgi:S-sulfo-L-cysteine synthase (O-acetyl-L-serine-dependent)
LQLLGAEVEELPGKSQCYDPSDPNDPLVHVEREIASHKDTYVYTNQYFNEKNVQAHYQSTGKEILNDVHNVDYFFSGLGTTGSTKGITQALREKNPFLKSIGVISKTGDTIPGIRNAQEMFEVGLFDKNIYDDILEMDSQEAIDGSLTLIRRAGILVGPTGGAAYQAILNYFKNHPQKKPVTVIFLACDRFEWYLSYYQERRPELFGQKPKPDSLRLFTNTNSTEIQKTPAEVQLLSQEKNTLTIDIRSNIAYTFGHIPGSINIPEDSVEQILDRAKPFPLQTTIIYVCPTGDRSTKLASYTQKQGYQSWSLQSGILNWRTQGLPLETTL